MTWWAAWGVRAGERWLDLATDTLSRGLTGSSTAGSTRTPWPRYRIRENESRENESRENESR